MPEPARPIRILLLDDHALFREGMARLLASEPDLEVAAHCAGVSDALAALASTRIDLVLLDVDLGGERGLDFLRRARESGFDGPVLVVTAGLGAGEASALLAQGAAGLFFKHDSAQLLAKGIRTVAEGRAWIDQQALSSLVGVGSTAPRAEPRALTTREREVLKGVFDGFANKEIASQLMVSESAIKAVLQQLFPKTGVRTRSQLVRVALERYAREL